MAFEQRTSWHPRAVARSERYGFSSGRVAFAPDGTSLVHLENAYSRFTGIRRSLREADFGAEEARYSVPGGGGPIAFSPDGQRIVMTGGPAADAWIFDARTPANRIHFSGAPVATAVVVSPGGAWWAVSGLSSFVCLFDWNGSELSRIEIPYDETGEFLRVSAMAVSPDGRTLVTADDGGTREHAFHGGVTWQGVPAIRAWSVAGVEVRPRWTAQGLEESALAISPDGALLVAGTTVFRLADGQAVGRIDVAPPVKQAAFFPDGRLILNTGWSSEAPRLMLFDAHLVFVGDLKDGQSADLADVSSFAIRADGAVVTAGASDIWLWTESPDGPCQSAR